LLVRGVGSRALQQVVEYLRYHYAHRSPDVPIEEIATWDARFVLWDDSTLSDLADAAKKLEITPLLYLVSVKKAFRRF
jgi:hypothetical protein